MHQHKFLSFKFTVLLAGIALTTSSFMSGDQKDAPVLDGNKTEDIRKLPLKEIVVDFRGVAKKAIPAVVAIKVQAQSKARISGDENQAEDPFELFGGNNLWQFFGVPRRDAKQEPLVGQASGVIVNPKGYILTNSHVVHEMDSIKVQLTDGREFNAKLLGEDPNSDLALIKIDAENLPYLTLGNSDNLEVGQWVAAIGNPFGLQATLTVGVVSAKGRNNLDIARYEDFIQTDAAINRGNSGGPLISLDGEIIGINTAIATTSSSGYIGIGFAIPSNMAKHVMDEILSDGKISRGFLGLGLQSIDQNLAKAFGLKKVEGALVAEVSKNSAAEKAGLQAEDVILSYNDRPVENAASLRNAVYMMKPGTKITLTVLRNEKEIKVPVTVGEFTEGIAAASPAVQKSSFGIEVSNLTPELAQSLGYGEYQGVIITKVNPDSAAALAGIKKGALILSVNRQKVANIDDYNKALAQVSKEKPLLLQIKQGNHYPIYISFQGE